MNTYRVVITTALIAAFGTPAHALDPASIDYENLQITPTVEVFGSYDSNYLTSNDAIGSHVINITPSVNVTYFGEKSTYQLNYSLDKKLYRRNEADDLTNHLLDLTAEFEFDVRNALKLEASINKTQAAADVYTLGELNEFTTKSFGAGYTYGAPSATGNIELGFSHKQIRSDNDFNDTQESNSTAVNAAFIYRVTDKTRLTAEVIGTKYDYINYDILDASNIAYLIGARWEATAKTTGYAKIGRETKRFDDSDKDNTSLTKWEISADWQPKTYSIVRVKTTQEIEEGLFGADFIDARKLGLDWKHDWGRGYTSKLSASAVARDYSNGREDDSVSYGIGLAYSIKRWLDVSIDYSNIKQDSTDILYDYNRDIINLKVDMSL